MPFAWSDFRVLATHLVTKGGDAELRSAISRAYYAAYNQAKNRLDKSPIRQVSYSSTGDKLGSHERIWQTYATVPPTEVWNLPDWQEVGDLGKKVQVLRVNADYFTPYPKSPTNPIALRNDVTQALKYVDRILALLPTLRVK